MMHAFLSGTNKKQNRLESCSAQVKPGDKVIYFKWAGDSMETPSGEQYVVVHEADILSKV